MIYKEKKTGKPSSNLKCLKTKPKVDYRGAISSTHEKDESFKIEAFCDYLKKVLLLNPIEVFWRVWAISQKFSCKRCNREFTGADLYDCSVHLNPEPVFEELDAFGRYTCCGATTRRFKIFQMEDETKGCIVGRHVVTDDSLPSYKLVNSMARFICP